MKRDDLFSFFLEMIAEAPLKKDVITNSPEDTFNIGEQIGRELKGGELVLLLYACEYVRSEVDYISH